MYCPSCGKENADTSSFCQHCGQPLKLQAAPPQPAPQPAPQPVQPQPVVVMMQPPQQDDEEMPVNALTLALRFVLVFVGTFALGYLLVAAWNWAMPLVGDAVPFLGMNSVNAAEVAQNYVDTSYPEFSNAIRSTSSGYVDGTPVYIVDFIYPDPPQGPKGLRVLVTRDLSFAWALEVVEGIP